VGAEGFIDGLAALESPPPNPPKGFGLDNGAGADVFSSSLSESSNKFFPRFVLAEGAVGLEDILPSELS